MSHHDDDPITGPTIDTERETAETASGEAPAAGDEHLGLEGGTDIRPPSARETLRLP